MGVNGIDVSSYQPDRPDTRGLDFMIIKATEGLGYVNPKARNQLATAREAGLVAGLYHYPHISNGGQAEADRFAQVIGELGVTDWDGTLLVLDWEWYGQQVSDDQARAYKDAFLEHLHQLAPHHRRLAYVDRNNWLTVDQNGSVGDGLWIADYVPKGHPRIADPWVIHQYTDTPQDQDYASFGSRAEMAAWARFQQWPPPPVQAPAPAAEQEIDMTPLVLAAGQDWDIPVEPAGTAQAPRGALRNEGIFLGVSAQGSGTLAVSWRKDGKWENVSSGSVSRDTGKHTITLPQDGSVDVVRLHSDVALLAYVAGRQAAQ